ncbi:UNVERIFIED_CONTAM: Retrovirus-related Pol polyprotein from transposon TNT 1-94 [Sesamum latifolium]|uniref:Retrovirus-related Pol polyprotein from transposon TNT 1-94 n=1 Tax=Sesamum latifolium TaxID=2727402 RepID=A0AAW2XXH5_9LAMI
MANEKLCDVKGLGDVCMTFENGFKLILKNVRHVPELAHNLISCSALEEEGLEGRWDYVHADVWGSANVDTHGDKVRCLLISSGLAKTFWGEALLTAAYLINRSPSVPLLGKIPECVWTDSDVNLSSLCIFGCSAFALTDGDKLDPRSQKCIFIGYPEGVKGYRLWNRSQPGFKVIISRNVIFNESEFSCLSKIPKNTDEYNIEGTFNKVEDKLEDNQQGEEVREEQTENNENINPELENVENQYLLARDRERRQSRLPSRFKDFHLALNAEGIEPTSYDEALKTPESNHWIKAMKEEMKSLHDNKIWVLVPKPKNVSLVDYLGNAKKILGMTIERDRRNSTIFLNQSSYVKSVLKNFSMTNSKPPSVPFAAHFQLCKDQSPKTDSEKEKMKNVPYSNAIGSVMYLMVSTRPDIAYSVSCLSRFMSNPGSSHWEALKWLLRYLKGSVNNGIKFSKCSQGANLVGYVDSNYANDRDSRKSTTSYVFTLCGACISWKS